MATRAYELSKKLGISNKELLELLKEHGYSLSNIAVVPEEAIVLIEKIFSQRTSGQKSDVVSEPKKEETSTPSKSVTAPEAQQVPQKSAPHKESPMPSKQSTFTQRAKPDSNVRTQQSVETAPQEIVLAPMSVADIAEKAHKHVSEVIITLLKQGIVATKNQLLPEKTVAMLAQTYGLTVIAKQKAKPAEEEKKPL